MAEKEPIKVAVKPERSTRTAITTLVLIAAVALLLLMLKLHIIWLLLLVFAGILIAVLLRGLGELVHQYTGLGHAWSLGIVVATLVGMLALGSWLLAPSLVAQFTELADRLPQALQRLREYLQRYQWGRTLLNSPEPQKLFAGDGTLMRRATGVVSSVLDVVVHLIVVIFVAIFLASEPRLYINGAVRMFPCRRRKRIREVMETVGYTLRWWLIGQGITMIVIGALTTLGLWLLNVPLALPLGILAAAFNFIPNFGPLISMIPAILLAMTVSPEKAVHVVLLFLVAQNFEGYLLTPMIQRRAVLLPPALGLIAQVLLGWLVGALGVVLAAPATAALVVIIKMLYVEDVLDDDVDVPGEQEAQREIPPEGIT